MSANENPLCIFGVILLAGGAVTFAQSSGPDPKAIVENLYKLHDAQQGRFFDKKNRKLLEQYFTKALAELIRKDSVAPKGEIGALDFDPLYDSQDPQITEFRIAKMKLRGNGKNEGQAVLDVRFKDSGKSVTIGFQLEQDTSKAWKIADIRYAEGRSLRAILRGN